MLTRAGEPPPADLRRHLELRLDADLSPVRVHTDDTADRAARALGARAFTLGNRIGFARGSYGPQTPAGRRLITHELIHTLQPEAAYLIHRLGDEEVGAPVSDPIVWRLEQAGADLRITLLPSVQAAIDGFEELPILHLGNRVLIAWTQFQQAYDSLSGQTGSYDAPWLPQEIQDQYDATRRELLVQLTLQEYRGRPVLESYQEPTSDQDLGAYIIERIHAIAWVLRDTASLVGTLSGSGAILEPDQWRAVGLLRQHQNPWDHAYMRAVLNHLGLERRLAGFRSAPAAHLRAIAEGQSRIRAMSEAPDDAGLIDPTRRLGQYQLLPADSAVRLLQPMTPAEVASRFYGDAGRWRSHLLPYNRGTLSGAGADDLLAPDTLLRLDAGLLSAEFAPLFAYVARAGRRQGTPYIHRDTEEAAVPGNSLRFSVALAGDNAYDHYNVAWWIENDPVAVEREGVPARVDGPRGRVYWVGDQDANSFEATAAAPGNHIVHCRFWFDAEEPSVLRRVVTVMTLEQKTELASHRRFADFARSPRALLEDLQAELSRPGEGRGQAERRRAIEERIAQVRASLDDYDRPYLSPLRAVYVSADERPTTLPLAVSVGRDRTYDWSYRGYHLILYDLSLQGRPFVEQAEGERPMEALRTLLREFADNAPYPSGNIRFEVNPSTLAYFGIGTETLIYPTDGGMLIDDVLRGLSGAALAVGLGAAVLGQAQIAIPALAVSGLLAGAAGAFAIADRLEHGQFDWDTATALDLMDIAGALLTLGMSRAATASVRGVGRLTLLSQAVDVGQIGIMAGVHYGQISTAVQSGDQGRVYEALLNAARDGALYLIVHRASAGLRGRPDVPEAAAGQRTMTGLAQRGGAGPPAGPVTAEAGTPAYFRQHHDRALARLGTEPFRPGTVAIDPAQPAPRPGTQGEPFPHTDFDGAYAAYEQAMARAAGREVGIYRNVTDGRYAVRIGTRNGVGPPGEGWEAVLHYHPNPENALTFRMPAPADVQGAQVAAFRAGSPVVEMIEHPLPGGGRARTRYSVDPASGRISVEYTGADGRPVQRDYASLEAYQQAYFQRTFYVDPESPEYQWMLQDLHGWYRHAPFESGGGQTMAGAARSTGPEVRMPEGASADQGARLSQAIERIRAQGVPVDEPLLELYLHQQRGQLDGAIATIERVASSPASAEGLLPVGRGSPRATDVQLSDIFAMVPEPAAGPAAAPASATPPSALAAISGEPTLAPVAGGDRTDLVRFWDDEIRRAAADPNEPSWRQHQFRAYRDRVLRGERPTWRQTEYELAHYYGMVGGEAETPFIHGRAADRYTPGSTRPDVTASNVMVEGKNYRLVEVDGTLNRSNLRSLIRTLRHQIGQRAEHGPARIPNQSVVVDLRGQPATQDQITSIAREIAGELGDELTRVLGRPTTFPVHHIQVLTW